MAPFIRLVLASLVLVSTSAYYVQQNEEGFISGVISDKGLDFAKDILIEQGIVSVVQLQLPEIEKSVQVPFIGNAKVVLSEITIKDIQVNSSSVVSGESGIFLLVSGATADLTMNWRLHLVTVLSRIETLGAYSVEGMQVGLTVDLRNEEGTLKLILLDYGCYVTDLSIKLEGGASWLYQVLVDAFQGNIASAVEQGISDKISEGIGKLDTLLQSLPKQISVDNFAQLNVSFVGNPILSNTSVAVAINGLFTERNVGLVPQGYRKELQVSSACGGLPKMIKVSIHENVFKSASLVYFNAGKMQMIIDELPNQAILNTAEWRFIVPQLYKQYPNDDMQLNISASSPPVILVDKQDVRASVLVDITIDVLEAGEVIPVACISVDISGSCSVDIIRNKINGRLKLQEFSAYLKWSKIGKLHISLIQSLISTALKTVVVPYLNLELKKGLALPTIDGFAFQNANILYYPPWITVCTDVSYSEDYYLTQHSAYVS
ncbi:hypothetical protein PIB30_059952 [Stylosanthes scabra]|uniref:Lipid-binding serum glycoprotein C-terminal domain-containing protein n=1 Tax=Stylosanthes scabra TaxID=79078 RepID=A0ABU6RKS2_9FABA|nr:hypothetical protein [Stylosanthes scabra]